LRLQFCENLLAKIKENANFIENLWMSDEAHFHLTGYVNKQNMRYWAQTMLRFTSVRYTVLKLLYGVLCRVVE
jgi:hypothetical protein